MYSMYVHSYVYLYILGVTNLRSTSLTTSTVDIAWNAAAPNTYCGPILYYTISITNENTDHAENSTGLTTAIDGLMSNTTYNVTVIAFNKIRGGMSNTISIRTAATGSSEPGMLCLCTHIGPFCDKLTVYFGVV